MLTLPDLRTLVRDLSSTRMLSVYLETRVTNPAMREAWRPALSSALRELGAGLPKADRARFARARALLERELPPVGASWKAEGWMAFVTAAGLRFAGEVPTRCPTLTVWRDGPVVAPYMRVLKELRPVIIALVDSRSARVYRYAWGKLIELPEFALTANETTGPGVAHGPDGRGEAGMGPRSTTGTEWSRDHQAVAFDHLATTLAQRLTELAGEDGWILIGGTPEWSRRAGDAMPGHLGDRVMVSPALVHDAPADGIAGAARHAATSLRAARGEALLTTILDHAGPHGRAASGVAATKRALEAQAVDCLVLSPEFVTSDAQEAEEAVRAALLQGASVNVLSNPAAEHLSTVAGGIAARLRFAVE